MNKEDTTLAVARYVIANAENLIGLLGAEHYFAIAGASSVNESILEVYRPFRGFAVDILAEVMNKKEGDFWRHGADMNPGQADDPFNAELIPFASSRKGIVIIVKEFNETPEGFLVRVPIIRPKSYLKALKSPGSFKQYISREVYEGKRISQVNRTIDRLFGS